MSPLPERRKTAEELAKLRESLGISADGPPPDAPGVRREEPAPGSDEVDELKAAVFEQPDPARDASWHDRPGHGSEELEVSGEAKAVPDEPPMTGTVMPEVGEASHLEVKEDESPVTETPPPHSLRKSASLVVDQPKPVRHRPDGSLPARRHTDEELMRLRRMDAGPAVSPVEALARRTVSVPVMILFYLLALAAVALLIMESLWFSKAQPFDLPFEWLGRAVQADWYGTAIMSAIGGISAGVLLIAAWVAWRRPLSRHHAGFMTIIAVLVLVFGTLYFFPELHGA
jgi:hypothetical protein